jgi:hypothetical protein
MIYEWIKDGGNLMKFLSLFLSIVTLGLFTSPDISAHIFKVKRWENNNHAIYTISDYHSSFGAENKVGAEQRKDLVAAAKSAKAHVIAEDMLISKKSLTADPRTYHTKNQTVSIESVNKVSPNKTPLYGLVSACKDAGIEAYNAEFRQAKRGSFDGFVPAADAVAVSEAVLAEIKSYDDGAPYNDFYKKFLNRYEKEIFKPCGSMLNTVKKASGTFSDLITSLDYTVPVQRVFDYLSDYINDPFMTEPSELMAKRAVVDLYDMELLDMRMLHQIAQVGKQKPLFVCAGYKHIENIEPYLEALGYEVKDEAAKDEFLIAGMEPQALDLKEVFTHSTSPADVTTNKVPVIDALPKITTLPYSSLVIV